MKTRRPGGTRGGDTPDEVEGKVQDDTSTLSYGSPVPLCGDWELMVGTVDQKVTETLSGTTRVRVSTSPRPRSGTPDPVPEWTVDERCDPPEPPVPHPLQLLREDEDVDVQVQSV